MTKTLDQEKFETVKALAEVQTSLSEGQAELLKLKENTEAYIVVREKEAEERVKKVLELSREALAEIDKNHDELTKFSTDLKEYTEDLKKMSGNIISIFTEFKTSMGKAEADMSEHHQNITDILTQVKAQRIHIAEDRKMLERERKQTNDEARLVIDRKAQLERGFAELKRLKDKKD